MSEGKRQVPPFQVERWCNGRWGPVEENYWCEDWAWLEAERHRRWWKKVKNIEIPPEHVRVVEHERD